MHINLRGHHLEITEPLHDYVNEKFTRLKRHFDHIITAELILSKEKQVKKAEATLHVAGADLFAEAKETDMYAAIDALVDKLDKQLIKRKEKITDHHHGAGR